MLGRTSCHSIKPSKIRGAGFFNIDKKEEGMGSRMGGEFAIAAGVVAGYGGSISRKSMEKARDAEKNKNNSQGG